MIASSIGAGQNSTAGTVRYVGNLTVPKPKINAPEMPMPSEEILSKLSSHVTDSTPLKIHHGTEANQAINFYINDMHTKSLGIDGAKVTTRQNATSAISQIDSAINYALNEAIHCGAGLQRLEYTNANVTTMNENIQAAESKMRDTDMAKTFTAYTKHNVLTQAAQSMLAQANQSSSAVLNLLQ